MALNDNQLAAAVGLVGSLVGAAAALLGTWQSNRHNAREAKAQRALEREREHEKALKDAYVEWMHALQIRCVSLAKLAVFMNQHHKVNNEAVYDEVTQDVAFNAARLKLTEDRADVYQLIDDTIVAYHASLGLIIKPQATPAERSEALDRLSLVARKAQEGLRSRFTGQELPMRPTKPPSPSEPQTPPKPEPPAP